MIDEASNLPFGVLIYPFPARHALKFPQDGITELTELAPYLSADEPLAISFVELKHSYLAFARSWNVPGPSYRCVTGSVTEPVVHPETQEK